MCAAADATALHDQIPAFGSQRGRHDCLVVGVGQVAGPDETFGSEFIEPLRHQSGCDVLVESGRLGDGPGELELCQRAAEQVLQDHELMMAHHAD